MRRELWPDHVDHELDIENYFTRAMEETAVFVAEYDGQLAGFIEIGTREFAEGCTSSPVAYVEGWLARDCFRRIGIGRSLMTTAVQWAKNRGLSELASDCHLENSTSAAAHRACGFTETERIICFRQSLLSASH